MARTLTQFQMRITKDSQDKYWCTCYYVVGDSAPKEGATAANTQVVAEPEEVTDEGAKAYFDKCIADCKTKEDAS